MSEEVGQASRPSRYFEALQGVLTFGEALEFYSLPDTESSFVVYHELVERVDVHGRWCGEWSEDFMVMETSSISKLVGIWGYGKRVHIFWEHVGLGMLDIEEYGMEEQEDL
jgi:hypothetical protein